MNSEHRASPACRLCGTRIGPTVLMALTVSLTLVGSARAGAPQSEELKRANGICSPSGTACFFPNDKRVASCEQGPCDYKPIAAFGGELRFSIDDHPGPGSETPRCCDDRDQSIVSVLLSGRNPQGQRFSISLTEPTCGLAVQCTSCPNGPC